MLEPCAKGTMANRTAATRRIQRREVTLTRPVREKSRPHSSVSVVGGLSPPNGERRGSGASPKVTVTASLTQARVRVHPQFRLRQDKKCNKGRLRKPQQPSCQAINRTEENHHATRPANPTNRGLHQSSMRDARAVSLHAQPTSLHRGH